MANSKGKSISSATGLGVDFAGGPVIDPTANVIALTEAANKRQDDLREMTARFNERLAEAAARETALRDACQREVGDLRDRHRNDIGLIREQHQAQLRIAESQRLDAIRQVDREDVNKTAAQVLSAVQTLAQTNNTTAETLRTQVATTAAAASTTFATAMQEVNKRLSALELSSSEGKGKQMLADPQMIELLAEMKHVRGTSSGGIKDMTGYLIAAIGIGAAVMMYFK